MRYWYADMEFMCGVILGSRQKPCMLFHLYVTKYFCKIEFISNFFILIVKIFFLYRTECYDYLLDIAIQMKQYGLNPLATPSDYELKHQANGESHE